MCCILYITRVDDFFKEETLSKLLPDAHVTMNNTNQQLYAIYKNTQRFYHYRKLVALDEELTQDRFIVLIQKNKYMLLSAIDRALVSDARNNIDQAKLASFKTLVDSYNEASVTQDVRLTNILLVYPGTECETKRANMAKLINHVRFPNAEVLIITPIKVSSNVSKSLISLTVQKEHRRHEFRAFTYMLLSSIIPEHVLAPKYINLLKEDIDNLKLWFLEPEMLPKIYENDPQMVWIGAKVDDVVAFKYPSEITIEAVRYCKVIPSV